MKKNLPLIVAIAIPALMILLVAGSIYVPSLFVKPTYNFLYASGTYYPGSSYSVSNGMVTQSAVPYPANDQATVQPQLFLYNTAKDQSQPLSLSDAQKLSLDPSTESPDGFQLASGNYGGDGFPFFFGSYDNEEGWYLKGHNLSKKVNLQTIGGPYSVTFLGWIK